MVSLLIAVVVMAIVFDYINGFHDTANAIATVVSTGVLPIRTAILLAAGLNFGGALLGTAVASTIGKGLIDASAVRQEVVLSALLGAVFGDAGTGAIKVEGLTKVVKSLIISPIVGFFAAFVVMIFILWAVRRTGPVRLSRIFRRLQMLSAGFMALS